MTKFLNYIIVFFLLLSTVACTKSGITPNYKLESDTWMSVNDINLEISSGINLIKIWSYDSAYRLFSNLSATNKESFDARFYKWQASYLLKNYSGALVDYVNVLNIRNDALTHKKMANCYEMLWKIEFAYRYAYLAEDLSKENKEIQDYIAYLKKNRKYQDPKFLWNKDIANRLVWYRFVPHSATINITFLYDGTFIFNDYSSTIETMSKLRGRYLVDWANLVMLYDDREMQIFDLQISNSDITISFQWWYYFVKGIKPEEVNYRQVLSYPSSSYPSVRTNKYISKNWDEYEYDVVGDDENWDEVAWTITIDSSSNDGDGVLTNENWDEIEVSVERVSNWVLEAEDDDWNTYELEVD